MKVKSESEVAQSCPTLCDHIECSLPGSSVHWIFQARVLQWVAIAFSVLNPQTLQNLLLDTALPFREVRSSSIHQNTGTSSANQEKHHRTLTQPHPQGQTPQPRAMILKILFFPVSFSFSFSFFLSSSYKSQFIPPTYLHLTLAFIGAVEFSSLFFLLLKKNHFKILSSYNPHGLLPNIFPS